jgi:hypothetical protein
LLALANLFPDHLELETRKQRRRKREVKAFSMEKACMFQHPSWLYYNTSFFT